LPGVDAAPAAARRPGARAMGRPAAQLPATAGRVSAAGVPTAGLLPAAGLLSAAAAVWPAVAGLRDARSPGQGARGPDPRRGLPAPARGGQLGQPDDRG